MRPTVGRGFLIALLFVSQGCREERVTHPDARYFGFPRPPIAVIALEPSTGSASVVADSVLSGDRMWGRLNGGPGEAFGELSDAVITLDGRVLALDGLAHRLLLFEEAGETSPTIISRKGSGPGELVEPVAIDLDSVGDAHVFQRSGKVSRFRFFDDSTAFLRALQLPLSLSDGCIIGDRLFVYAITFFSTQLIHIYTLDGDYVGSFGPRYQSRNALLAGQLGRGKIACNTEEEIVTLLPSIMPYVATFSSDGDLLWWALIKGVLHPTLTETSRGTRLAVPKPIHHTPVRITPLKQIEAVGIQFARTERRPDYFDVDYLTIGLSVKDASVTFRLRGNFEWLTVENRRRVRVRPYPFPRMVLSYIPDPNGGP